MPNFNLVVDTSNFKPFDINTDLSILRDYRTNYEKNQAVYDKIALTLGDLKAAVANSPKAKEIYETYYGDFDKAARDFAGGMDAMNLRALGDLRYRYGTDIRLLELALKAIADEANRRRADKDLTNIYLNIGTLDDYLTDPNRVSRKISGALVTVLAELVFKNLALELNEAGKLNRLDEYVYLWATKKGRTSKLIADALASKDPAKMKDAVLREALNSVIDSTGVKLWGDKDAEDAVTKAAMQGMWSAIGTTSVQALVDLGKQWEMQALMLLLKNLAKKKQAGDAGSYASNDIDYLKTSELYNSISNLKKTMFNANGSLKNTYFGDASHKFYNPIKLFDEAKALAVSKYDFDDSAFGEFMSSNWGVPLDPFGALEGANKDKLEKAMTDIRNKYKLSNSFTFLTPDLYHTLTALGYNAKSTWKDFRDINLRVNDSATDFIHASPILPDYDVILTPTMGMITSAYKDGTPDSKMALYEFNNDGTLGDVIKDLSKLDWNTKAPYDNKLTDVRYSFENPKMLSILVNTHKVYINPYLINNEIGDLITQTGKLYESNDKLAMIDRAKPLFDAVWSSLYGVPYPNKISYKDAKLMVFKDTILKLTEMFKAFNKQASKTSDKA